VKFLPCWYGMQNKKTWTSLPCVERRAYPQHDRSGSRSIILAQHTAPVVFEFLVERLCVVVQTT